MPHASLGLTRFDGLTLAKWETIDEFITHLILTSRYSAFQSGYPTPYDLVRERFLDHENHYTEVYLDVLEAQRLWDDHIMNDTDFQDIVIQEIATHFIQETWARHYGRGAWDGNTLSDIPLARTVFSRLEAALDGHISSFTVDVPDDDAILQSRMQGAKDNLSQFNEHVTTDLEISELDTLYIASLYVEKYVEKYE